MEAEVLDMYVWFSKNKIIKLLYFTLTHHRFKESPSRTLNIW